MRTQIKPLQRNNYQTYILKINVVPYNVLRLHDLCCGTITAGNGLVAATANTHVVAPSTTCSPRLFLHMESQLNHTSLSSPPCCGTRGLASAGTSTAHSSPKSSSASIAPVMPAVCWYPLITYCGLYHSTYSNSHLNLTIFDPDIGRGHIAAVVSAERLVHDNLLFHYADEELVTDLAWSEESVWETRHGMLQGPSPGTARSIGITIKNTTWQLVQEDVMGKSHADQGHGDGLASDLLRHAQPRPCQAVTVL